MKVLLVSLLTGLLLLLCTPLTFAHKASDSYLRINIEDETIQGQWDIALRDLELAIGIDGNDDGQITWGELRIKQEAIEQYALTRLQFDQRTDSCWSQPQQYLIDSHTDGAYAVLSFSVICPKPISTVEIEYNLLFDIDPLHRGLLYINFDGHAHTGVFSPEQQSLLFDRTKTSPWSEFLQFGREGIWHILIGYDHILFLLSLLLPAVLYWKHGQWHPHDTFGPVLWAVLKIVTAFTLAHSITLSLAVLGLVSLPSRWVESAIAASVLAAALHNLYPIFRTRLWVMTFIFGLIHGLGFASVLIDLGLPGQSLALALAGFNVGVEIGQIVIVGVLIPLAFLIRRSWSYQHIVLSFGSIIIVLVAFLWLLERSMDMNVYMGTW